jgi:hypothetical protein
LKCSRERSHPERLDRVLAAIGASRRVLYTISHSVNSGCDARRYERHERERSISMQATNPTYRFSSRE